jgi:hypothetical protein
MRPVLEPPGEARSSSGATGEGAGEYDGLQDRFSGQPANSTIVAAHRFQTGFQSRKAHIKISGALDPAAKHGMVRVPRPAIIGY